jgi:hypothetical protein
MPKKNADGVPGTFKKLFKNTSLKEKEVDVFKMFNLMKPLITTFEMGSTLFNIK